MKVKFIQRTYYEHIENLFLSKVGYRGLVKSNGNFDIHGLGHKSWQLFYFVDICERITSVYVSYGMSAGIVSTHVVNTLSFRLYMSHFLAGLVSSKTKIVAMTFAPTYISDMALLREVQNLCTLNIVTPPNLSHLA